MNFTFTKATLVSSLRQRNVALWSCLGLSLANLVLVLKVSHMEEHWVLMPQYDDEHRLEVTRSKYSDAYLIDWATGILTTLLCANPDSIDWKISQILKISRSNYGQLKQKLQAESRRIRQDQVSTAFYPGSYKVNAPGNTIEVSGEHSAWFGRDSAPVITHKTFRLAWAIHGHGVILLEDFQEIKDEHP